MLRGMVLLAVSLLVGLSGCGPAPSDNATSLDSSAGVAGGGLTPFPAPREVSDPLGTGAVAGGKGDSSQDRLVVPDWMAKDLASPDAQVRLKAVDRWAQQAPTGSVDPLIQALEDKDEQVQARALELIVQDWAAEQATGQGQEAR